MKNTTQDYTDLYNEISKKNAVLTKVEEENLALEQEEFLELLQPKKTQKFTTYTVSAEKKLGKTNYKKESKEYLLWTGSQLFSYTESTENLFKKLHIQNNIKKQIEVLKASAAQKDSAQNVVKVKAPPGQWGKIICASIALIGAICIGIFWSPLRATDNNENEIVGTTEYKTPDANTPDKPGFRTKLSGELIEFSGQHITNTKKVKGVTVNRSYSNVIYALCYDAQKEMSYIKHYSVEATSTNTTPLRSSISCSVDGVVAPIYTEGTIDYEAMNDMTAQQEQQYNTLQEELKQLLQDTNTSETAIQEKKEVIDAFEKSIGYHTKTVTNKEYLDLWVRQTNIPAPKFMVSEIKHIVTQQWVDIRSYGAIALVTLFALAAAYYWYLNMQYITKMKTIAQK